MKNKSIQKTQKRTRRHKKIRTKISGTTARPRLSVFRSNKFIYVQLIDDTKGATLASASSKDSKAKTMRERAKDTGKKLAELAKTKKLSKAVFDRGGFLYRGSIAALAEGAREGGLKF